MSDNRSSGGSNRDWGYASYDVDRSDDYSSSNLQYTSYENSGSVNKYSDNGDGGHSHEHWSSSSDYNSGKDPDYSRLESGRTENPSTGDIQSNGGCYLTTACLKHMNDSFDDNCEELIILRWFRDNFVSKEDIAHYYRIAPIIVEELDKSENCDKIYRIIYRCVVQACVYSIKIKNYKFAYDRYKQSIQELEEKYAKPRIANDIAKALSLHAKKQGNNKKNG